jgi:hypothetical protein
MSIFYNMSMLVLVEEEEEEEEEPVSSPGRIGTI